MGNTEGTPRPGDSVETAREASTEGIAPPTTGSSCYYCKVVVPSSVERLLNLAFHKLSISFSTQVVVPIPGRRYHVDLIVLQRPVIVEADEDYHTRQPGQANYDTLRDADFRAAGYEVFRFNEEQLGTDADGCAQHVMESAGLVPEEDPLIDIGTLLSGQDNPAWQGGRPAWTCATCGGHFHAYKRSGKPAITCSRECHRIWQIETKSSVKNRRSNSEQMKKLWADPEWRAQQTQRIVETRWPR